MSPASRHYSTSICTRSRRRPKRQCKKVRVCHLAHPLCVSSFMGRLDGLYGLIMSQKDIVDHAGDVGHGDAIVTIHIGFFEEEDGGSDAEDVIHHE